MQSDLRGKKWNLNQACEQEKTGRSGRPRGSLAKGTLTYPTVSSVLISGFSFERLVEYLRTPRYNVLFRLMKARIVQLAREEHSERPDHLRLEIEVGGKIESIAKYINNDEI